MTADRLTRIEPTFGYLETRTPRRAPGRDLVPVRAPAVPAPVSRPAKPPAGPDSQIAELARALDVRHMSPRQAVEMSMDLHMAGLLAWEEYAMLAFQPELHPDYDRTVGALIGEKARPDRRRDFVRMWEERLAFERRYNADAPKRIERTLAIVTLLRRIDAANTVVV